MRVTFVAVGWEQLSVSLLSAMAKRRGHEVSLAYSVSLFNDRSHLNIPGLSRIFDDRQDVMAAIQRQRPDVIAFSALSANYQWMLGIAAESKALFPRVKTVFGGVHPSAVPQRVLARPQVDYVCVGEGDVAFPMILDAIEKGDFAGPIPNTRYLSPTGATVRGPQAGFVQDLDALPAYDKELWEEHIPLGDYYITMASRGCPYRCTFCFNNFFAQLPDKRSGRYVRQRSPEHIMGELRLAKRRYNPRMIEFFDDVFTLDKKWLKSFLDAYKDEINIPFQCFTHVNYIDDDVGRWLSEAGCFASQIGVQSLDDEYKRKTVKRYERTADVEKTVKIFRKYKIRAKFDHMFGLPGEDIEAQEAARKFYADHPPYSIQTYWTNFFPGTQMMRQAQDLGLLSAEGAQRLNEGLDYDVYTNNNKHIDRQKIRAYKAYEITFKLMPHLPKWMRRRLNPQAIRKWPAPVCTLVSFMSDVCVGLMKLSPDHILYARYYLYHIRKFCCKRLGWPVRPATKRADGQRAVHAPPKRDNVSPEMLAVK
ncbi:MAG: hypothetical protein A3C36_05025 [Omnitrophica WOR_2 bacterium RIFCSPHIGHO2_02_FULL_52_10]|nr:MAG: hypothetical protein A3C36_05025 [Omnitrophica WOR_2 bacterium RIFCSPHIGHO2_02_FULL_52_10]